jgi:hypothetical protein
MIVCIKSVMHQMTSTPVVTPMSPSPSPVVASIVSVSPPTASVSSSPSPVAQADPTDIAVPRPSPACSSSGTLRDWLEQLILEGSTTGVPTLALHDAVLSASQQVEVEQAIARNTPSKNGRRMQVISIHRSGYESLVAPSRLFGGLQTNRHITTLRLGGCPLGDANALADALAMNDTITSLDLASCSLGAVGAATLARGLQTNRSLTHLGLSCNRITDGVIDHMTTGAHGIASLLTHNSALKEVDLKHNSITSVGVSVIAHALRTNPALTSLDLGNNPIDDGVVALADALHSNSHLAWLHVEHAQSTTLVGLTALAGMLHSNIGLRVLHSVAIGLRMLVHEYGSC